MSSTSVHPANLVPQLVGVNRGTVSSALQRLQRQPRGVQVLGFLTLFVVIAWLDFVVDRDLSLFALYLIPTLYSSWLMGIRWGYASCIASAAVWAIDDWGGSVFYHYALIPYWNVAERFIVLVAIVAIVNALKEALQDGYEAERRSVQRELEIAFEVQSRLLPSQAPNYVGLDFGFFYRPAREVGGDYYDFIPLDKERLGFTVGDVSGKGLPSALLMASLQGLVRTNLAVRQGDLSPFVREVNHSMYKLTASNRFATLFIAVIDASSKALDYVNAGHNPPLLFRTGAYAAENLEGGGLPVGLLADSQYQAGHLQLHLGDVLVAYTDGVVEAFNDQEEEFGEERLKDVVRSSTSLTAAGICGQVAERLKAYVSDTPQWDDISLIVMRVKPQ
jgi:serine phosphatase RsbU (regulator of sigma subunit)